MVTANYIRVYLQFDREPKIYCVGESVSGTVTIRLPGKLAVWKIVLSLGSEKITVVQNTVLAPGKNAFPFRFSRPLSSPNYQGRVTSIDQQVSVVIWPSRMHNELKGDRYIREFGGDFLGRKTQHFPLKVIKGNAIYRIQPTLINFRNAINYWPALCLFAFLILPSIPFILKFIALPVFLLQLYILEKKLTERNRFGHLRGELKTDARGKPHLHLTTTGVDDAFLDAEFGLRLVEIKDMAQDNQPHHLGAITKVRAGDVVIKQSHQKFIIPLPVPPNAPPPTVRYLNRSFRWHLEFRYQRNPLTTNRITVPFTMELLPPDHPAFLPPDPATSEQEDGLVLTALPDTAASGHPQPRKLTNNP